MITLNALARVGAPQPNLVVERGRGDHHTIRREGYRIDTETMAFKSPHALARIGVPQPHRPIV